MRYSLLVGLVATCTLAAQPEPGVGSIEGRVINSLTSAPVVKAIVVLTSPAAPIRLVAYADGEGRFQFTALPPGTYKISASRAGFLDRPARRPVSLGQSDHVTNAEVRLPPQGVIAGHVVDEDGDPVAGARVYVLKQVYRNGRKQWDGLNSPPLANDAGEYRIPNLAPGRYLVRADGQRPMIDNRYGGLPDKPRTVYVPAYYPKAPNEQAALPVDVGMGAEVRGIDIHLFQVAVPPSFRVTGKVTGVQPDPQIVIDVNLQPADGGMYAGNAHARAPDYAFDMAVRPGRYTTFAHVYSGGPEAYAIGSLTVAGNIAGVVLTMSPPPDVTGRITLAESGSRVNLQGVRVTLSRLPVYNSVPDVRSDATGKIVFAKPVAPGRYSIDVNPRSLPEGCFVQTVKLGGQAVSADDFEILASTQLEIVLSPTAGTITGSVSDADGKPFPNSSVTLIPADGKSRPVRQAADEGGNFKLTNLEPGKYKLFAWEEVDEGLWQDPEFRKNYENRGTEITVGPSETQNAPLRVISAEEMK